MTFQNFVMKLDVTRVNGEASLKVFVKAPDEEEAQYLFDDLMAAFSQDGYEKITLDMDIVYSDGETSIEGSYQFKEKKTEE